MWAWRQWRLQKIWIFRKCWISLELPRISKSVTFENFTVGTHWRNFDNLPENTGIFVAVCDHWSTSTTKLPVFCIDLSANWYPQTAALWRTFNFNKNFILIERLQLLNVRYLYNACGFNWISVSSRFLPLSTCRAKSRSVASIYWKTESVRRRFYSSFSNLS